MNGAKVIYSKENNFTVSVKDILKKVTRKTKIIFLANPNNPTGTYLTKNEVLDLRKKLNKKILLVIDDAYAEYMKNKDYLSGLDLFKNKDNVFLIEPQEYLSFCYLMERASIILTDSGGIQEEAPALGKPVLVMRDTTERFEAVDAGTVRLVGTDIKLIVKQVHLLLNNIEDYKLMSSAKNPYGDGGASEIIFETIKNFNLDNIIKKLGGFKENCKVEATETIPPPPT